MKMSEKPAVRGGEAIFKDTVPTVKLPIKDYIDSVLTDYKQVRESGMITNLKAVGNLRKPL